MNFAAIIWFALMVVFLVVEAACPIHLVSMWFAAGALVAMLTAVFGGQIWLQVVLFTLVSIGLLLALRPLLKKYITPKKVRTNVDSVIGSQGVVLEQIDNVTGTGRVKLSGMEWSARSAAGEVIAPGEVIVVEKIEGVKVFVSTANVPVK